MLLVGRIFPVILCLQQLQGQSVTHLVFVHLLIWQQVLSQEHMQRILVLRLEGSEFTVTEKELDMTRTSTNACGEIALMFSRY